VRQGSAFGVRRSAFRRLLVVHALQVPAIGLVCVSTSPWAWWPAAIWGSGAAILGTDSGWRWLNFVLMAEAVVWLSLALAA
jgi:hypothetical protein